MGWQASPRWCKTRKRYYVRLKGRQYILGADEATAHRKFAALVDMLGGISRLTVAPKTLGAACEAWLADNRSKYNAYCIRKFMAAIGEKTVNQIQPTIMMDFRRWCERDKLAPNTVAHCMKAAWRAIRWTHERGWIDSLPKKPEFPKAVARPRDIPPANLRKLLSDLRKNAGIRRRLRPLVVFVLATGCRPSEARLAKWEEFDLTEGVWRLSGARTKTGESRDVFLSRYALAALRVARRQGSTGWVFRAYGGTPYTLNNFTRAMKRFGVTPYQLRHSYAQAALGQTDMAIVAQMLGHRSLDTVKTYAQIRDVRLRHETARITVRPKREPLRMPPSDLPTASLSRPEGIQQNPRKSSGSRRQRTA